MTLRTTSILELYDLTMRRFSRSALATTLATAFDLCLLLLSASILSPALASQVPRQVKDINAVASQNSRPSPKRYPDISNNNQWDAMRFAQLGARAYFAAWSETTGFELYSSSGKTKGGVLVLDINPGPADSLLGALTKAGSKLFFVANDGKTGAELWITDGTRKGTRLVTDLYRGPSFSSPSSLCPLGNSGKIVFQANTPAAAAELYISDGTASGTTLLKDIYPGPGWGSPTFMKTFNNGKRDFVVFAGRTAGQGTELWVTDGTSAGTKLIKDILPGAMSSWPRYFQVLGKKVIFEAYTPALGRELWVTDGTAAGTKIVKDIFLGTGSGSDMYYGVVLGGKYYFQANDGKTGIECWVTDGTTTGTKIVADSNPGQSSGYFRLGVAMGTKIIYRGFHPLSGFEPWILNTVNGTTSLLKDVYGGSNDSNPSYFETLGNRIVFSAKTPVTGSELYITDGTASGTGLFKDIIPGSEGSNCTSMTRLTTNLVVFQASSVERSTMTSNLWVTNGTARGTYMIPVAWAGAPTQSSAPGYAVEVNGKLYFSADDGVNGRELWLSDGTSKGTTLFKDVFPGMDDKGQPNSSWPSHPSRIDNGLVFAAKGDKQSGRELWVSDGTASGTRLLADIFDGPGSSNPEHMARIGNKVIFAAFGYDNAKPRNYVGQELFVTDGTPAGTRFVADLNLGYGSSLPRGFTEIGSTGKFVFSAFGTSSKPPYTSIGHELYISDGTGAGTRLLKDIFPGGSSSPMNFEAMGGKVYFSAYTQKYQYALWVTDGTQSGTKMVKDIAPGFSLDSPRYLQAMGSKIYFQASDSRRSGWALWESDGTTAGTKLLKRITPSSYYRGNSYITAAGSRRLWFMAETFKGQSYLGKELWTSDLTSAGTKLHTDINPGRAGSWTSALSSGNDRFVVVGSKVFFSAYSFKYGHELWLVDNGATATRFGDACKSSHMSGTDPVLGGTAKITGTTKSGFSANVVLLGVRSATALAMGGECRLHLNPLGPLLIVGASTGASYTAALPIPNLPRLMGLQMALQTVHLGSSFPGGSGFSNGLEWVVGK